MGAFGWIFYHWGLSSREAWKDFSHNHPKGQVAGPWGFSPTPHRPVPPDHPFWGTPGSFLTNLSDTVTKLLHWTVGIWNWIKYQVYKSSAWSDRETRACRKINLPLCVRYIKLCLSILKYNLPWSNLHRFTKYTLSILVSDCKSKDFITVYCGRYLSK